MSRNLGTTVCARCGSDDFFLGDIRPATQDDVGRYDHYVGMNVRDVTCRDCGAQYLGWVGKAPHSPPDRVDDVRKVGEFGFYDLSFRSTFNDEPGEDDLPPWSGISAPPTGWLCPVCATVNAPHMDTCKHCDSGGRE